MKIEEGAPKQYWARHKTQPLLRPLRGEDIDLVSGSWGGPPMPGDCKDQRNFTLWATLWLSECWRLARPGAPVLVFTDWRQLLAMTDAIQATGFEWCGIVVGHKPSARPMLGSFRRDCEFVLHAVKTPARTWSRRCFPGVYHHNVAASQKVHLTGKPLALLVDVLGVTPEGGTVLDPFVGGGTTPLACIETGKKFTGVELSTEYFRLIEERIRLAETGLWKGQEEGY